MKPVLIVAAVLAALILLIWVGTKIKPAAFHAFSGQPGVVQTAPLPAGLPAPVERFYRQTYGDALPVVETAVVSGRGWMRFFGLNAPIRFRFSHEAGHSFRHDIHITLFGLPLVKGFETYIDGRGWANTPAMKEGTDFDQGSNVSLWAEALNWFPALLLTDPRVEWRPVDEATALLVVPFGSGQETLVVRFDPASGMIQYIEAMKFKSAENRKVLWLNGVWFDEGRPWIELNAEDIVLNVEVREYIRARRP